MSNVYENLSTPQKARAALHRDTRALCSETCHFLGLEVTKPAMEIIAELVYKKLSVYGADLEAFAKHAKRTTINADDVKLLVRRNPALKSHLNAISQTLPTAAKDKRRKTVAPTTKPTETPAAKNKDSLLTNKENRLSSDLEEVKQSDVAENMIVDDITIDLTFD